MGSEIGYILPRDGPGSSALERLAFESVQQRSLNTHVISAKYTLAKRVNGVIGFRPLAHPAIISTASLARAIIRHVYTYESYRYYNHILLLTSYFTSCRGVKLGQFHPNTTPT